MMISLDFASHKISSWAANGIVENIAPKKHDLKRKNDSNVNKKRSQVNSISGTQIGVLAGTIMLSVASLCISGLVSDALLSVGHLSPVSISSSATISIGYPSYGYAENLNSVLDKIPTVEDDAYSADKRSVIATKKLLPKIHASALKFASIGLDGDRNIFVKFKTDKCTAYLTVEPSLLHLLVIPSSGNNIYFDDVAFTPGNLPSKISRALESFIV